MGLIIFGKLLLQSDFERNLHKLRRIDAADFPTV
ncbi:hypothetical protein CLV81_2315 [Flagellimonas meridianipacifica]|uniref:Uncharacterized protein n=1 Tax=Flagellimonas meridianipacifica TaxID=1080225 RepID=A0A2T0M917_9FLAO|nr:hypothetical protein CLV81_2315 [Allomuricauda pacifica]